jgi:hypothetical protein
MLGGHGPFSWSSDLPAALRPTAHAGGLISRVSGFDAICAPIYDRGRSLTASFGPGVNPLTAVHYRPQMVTANGARGCGGQRANCQTAGCGEPFFGGSLTA